MWRTRYCLLIVGLSIGPASANDIHRCVGAAGEPSFSHHRCDSAAVAVSPPRSVAGEGLRASERDWLANRAAQRGAASGPAKVVDRADRERAAHRCRQKRRALDKVRAKLRRGYKPAQGERLRRQRRAHEDYLSTFCS